MTTISPLVGEALDAAREAVSRPDIEQQPPGWMLMSKALAAALILMAKSPDMAQTLRDQMEAVAQDALELIRDVEQGRA